MNDIVITLDVDWAPDFVIDAVAGMLVESQVRATWFVTHQSPALNRLREHSDLFELGIHPNFLPGSTHGDLPSDVLRHCMDLVPEAVSMRTHSLYQSGPLFQTVFRETPIHIDTSICLYRMPHIRPVAFFDPMIRVPFYWEDYLSMHMPHPSWKVDAFSAVPGLKVFSFHPVHVYLNSSIQSYDRVRALGRISGLRAEDLTPHIRSDEGPQALFGEIIAYLRQSGVSHRVCDIARTYRDGQTD